MGLFSQKHKVGRCSILLSKRDDRSIANINIKPTPVFDEKKSENIEFVVKDRLPMLMFMFYFDKVVFNIPEKLSKATIEHFHTLSSSYVNKLSKNLSEENWSKILKKFKSPNNWIFTNTDVDSEKIVDMELFIRDNGHFFIQTHFPTGVENIEAKAYLTLEAFFQKVIEQTDYTTATLLFLPSFLAECSFYEGKRPELTKLGLAPHYGLAEGSKMLNEHGLDL